MYKLGIDVGGTNTDAVLLDEERKVVASVKRHTTPDAYDGILAAVRAVLEQAGVDRKEIGQAMLGTTQCTNAIVERKHLAPIGVLRLGAPATVGIPPMVDWAEDLKKIAVRTAVIGGGFEYDGKELAPFDETAARAFFEDLKAQGVKSVAISCVFSTVRSDHERAAAKLCREVMGEDVHVSISSEIGSMGLIERENATILNAALYRVAQSFTEGFARSLADEGVTNADVYLSQNDGTLMTMEHARRYPILTIACGPTNSIRGASYLSHLDNAIVIDVGGTNTDAVLIDEDLKVIGEVKYPTSGNVFEGIMGAVQKLLKQTQVDRSKIRQAMLGTTQCTNAIVERKNLAKIGLLRIGAPATVGVPPMVDWPEDIRFICEKSAIIGGGFEYDGKELAPLDEAAARDFFAQIKGVVHSIAISCVFSTVRADHERRAAEICREVMGEDVHISISSEIGSMGLIERENATILNAALYQVAERFTEGFAYSLAQEGITNAEVYLS
ncbi:MAG: hypothetical protein KH625_08410, partial [Firmicutes bacterium]|nr:hypothetical protein [Bacillota bacterium]